MEQYTGTVTFGSQVFEDVEIWINAAEHTWGGQFAVDNFANIHNLIDADEMCLVTLSDGRSARAIVTQNTGYTAIFSGAEVLA